MTTTLKAADQGKLWGKGKDFCLQEKDYKEKMFVVEGWDQETAVDQTVNKAKRVLLQIQEENLENLHHLEDKRDSFNLPKD